MSPAMQSAVERTAEIAEREGATVIEISEPAALARGRDVHGTIQNFEAAHALRHVWNNQRMNLSHILAETLAAGRAIAPDAYDSARADARAARHAVGDIFAQVDVLLAPSAPGAAPAGLASTGSPVFNKLWTLTGNPCVNLTGHCDDHGLPLGVQIIGRFGRDQTALSIASWLEHAVAAHSR